MKETQKLLIQVKEEATNIRKKKQEALYAKLSELEAKSKLLNEAGIREVQELRSQIKGTEEIQAK